MLTGPTASGKTSLAVRIAERIGGEIVSADSMAVYRGLDIGTAKPSAEDRRRVPHHGIDLVDPDEPYNLAQWCAMARAALAEIAARGRPAVVAGGTPLYLKAIFDFRGFSGDGSGGLPPPDPSLRARLAEEANRLGTAAIHARLVEADPAAAARIHPNDLRRIIRGLEIAAGGGLPREPADSRRPTRIWIRDLPRDLLVRRIERRVESMFAAGFVEEVRRVASAYGFGPTAGQAAGYREVLDFLGGRMTLAEAVEATKRRTRQLAKRQLTWLRSFPDAIWITG